MHPIPYEFESIHVRVCLDLPTDRGGDAHSEGQPG